MESPSRWILLLMILSLISLFFFPATSYADACWMKYFRKDSLVNTYMRAYAVDGENLWVGTNGDGVVVYSGKETKNYSCKNTRSGSSVADGLISDNITSIAIDSRNHRVWIGTNEGLSTCNLDGTDWKRFAAKDGLPNNVIRDVAVDDRGIVWVGTPSGVASFNGEAWKVFTTSTSGLYADSVHSITVKGNTVWVATVDGSVNRFDGETWKAVIHH